MENKSKKVKSIEAEVVGNSMEKSVKVSVEISVQHPVYRKRVYKKKTFLAHTEGVHQIGDKVKIVQSRPYSKNVKWVVVK